MNKKMFYIDTLIFITLCFAGFSCLYGFIKSHNIFMAASSLFFIVWAFLIHFNTMKEDYRKWKPKKSCVDCEYCVITVYRKGECEGYCTLIDDNDGEYEDFELNTICEYYKEVKE